jgi:hypothetical protein
MLPLHISLASHARVTIAVTKDVIGGVSLQAPIPDVPACITWGPSSPRLQSSSFPPAGADQN